MSITIEADGLDKLIRMANNFPAIAERHVNSSIKSALEVTLGATRASAPQGATRDLVTAWQIDMHRFKGILKSNTPYAVAVHEGTVPHYVSPRALAPWAEKKGLNPFAVSKSIQKKGTKANPFFKNAVDHIQQGGGYDKIFGKALKDLTIEISKT